MIHANVHTNGQTMTKLISVNGNSLPQLLVDLIDEGRWTVPADESTFDDVFSDHSGALLFD